MHNHNDITEPAVERVVPPQEQRFILGPQKELIQLGIDQAGFSCSRSPRLRHCRGRCLLHHCWNLVSTNPHVFFAILFKCTAVLFM